MSKAKTVESKREVEVKIDHIEGAIQDVRLDELEQKLSSIYDLSDYKHAYISTGWMFGEYGIMLVGVRDETDEEYNKRLKRRQAAQKGGLQNAKRSKRKKNAKNMNA